MSPATSVPNAATRALLRVTERPGWLIVSFARPQTCVSWAIHGGGRRVADTVAWCQVRNEDLPPGVDPKRLLARRLRAEGLAARGRTVGLLTSAQIDRFEQVTHVAAGVHARCVATVGLGNALRIGDATTASSGPPPRRVGTINLLVALSRPLAAPAALEALSLAAEARTAAILDAALPSRRSGAPVTGTGTDCIVVAAPQEARGAAYAGKHTAIGEVLGRSVYDAVLAGARRWKEEHACLA